MDHAVLLTGYSTEGDHPYWRIKNSWGKSWGNNGYIELAINGNGPGVCGCQ
jgi:C1A family cysteine protease